MNTGSLYTEICKHIVLCGIKHSGKTSVGRQLATMLGCDFFDSDELLLAFYNRSHPVPIRGLRELYRSKGKAVFMDCEYKAIKKHLAEVQELSILSLGGGASDNQRLLAMLKQSALLIYLDVPLETAYKRIIQNGLPPFLDPQNPRSSFEKLYEKRSVIYRSISPIHIQTQDATVEELGNLIYNKLVGELDVRQQHR